MNSYEGFPEFQRTLLCLPVQCTKGNDDYDSKNTEFLSKLT